MGLATEVEAMTVRHSAFHRALVGLLDGLAAEGFAALPGTAQDDAIGLAARQHLRHEAG